MDFFADILLGLGAFGAGFYCLILGRRLKRFNNLENGVGGAVAVLSAQVDDLTKTLAAAQRASETSSESLTNLVSKAENVSRQLELQMASLHDVPREVINGYEQDKRKNETEPMFVRHRSTESS